MAKHIGVPTMDVKYQVESDLRCLADAEEIRSDTKRMKACREMAKEKMAAMGAIAGSKAE